MKRKLKLSLMLLMLIMLMPIFSGCPNPDADLKVVRMNMGKKIPETDSGVFEVENIYDSIVAELKLKPKVGSFRIIYSESTRGEGSYKKISQTDCYNHAAEDMTVIINTSKFKQNYDYRLEFELYEDNYCDTKSYSSVTRFLHTYVTNKQNELKKITNAIGGQQRYCNVDFNGNYDVLYHENLFAQIAYSQVGYEGHGNKSTVNNCYNGDNYGLYNKFGSSQNVGNISVDFVKWVAQKAGILSQLNKKMTLPSSGNQILSWAKNNSGFFESSSAVDVGDLVIVESVECNRGVKVGSEYYIGIAYVKDHTSDGKYVYTYDNGPGFEVIGHSIFGGSQTARQCKGNTRYIQAVGYISMEGIAY